MVVTVMSMTMVVMPVIVMGMTGMVMVRVIVMPVVVVGMIGMIVMPVIMVAMIMNVARVVIPRGTRLFVVCSSLGHDRLV